jgi:N-succinyldiaminopimelate aminotransferase
VRENDVAWVAGSAELVAAVRTAKQFLTYVASGPFQYAIAEALRLPDTYYTAFREDLRTKRDLLAAGLTDAGFQVYVPRGTYFITTDIAELAPGIDALTFCRTLPKRCGVVAVPNSVFYDHPTAGRTQVRFAFCKKQDILTEAASRLRKAFND